VQCGSLKPFELDLVSEMRFSSSMPLRSHGAIKMRLDIDTEITASWRIRAKTTRVREQTIIGSDLISHELIRLVVVL
jgi:hypothetical protein